MSIGPPSGTVVLFSRTRGPALHGSVKRCTRCGKDRPLDQFPPVRRSEPGKLQTWCRACFAEANAANYAKNREREKTRLMARVAVVRAEVQRQLIVYLQQHPCVDCGESDILVLEFDHLRDKVADIATYANGGRTWPRILREIEKCEVRCANCHRLKTYERRQQTRPSEKPQSRHPRAVQLLLETTLGVRSRRACQRTLPLSDFPFRSLSRQSRHHICLACQPHATNEWYAREHGRQRSISRSGFVKRWRAAKQFVRAHLEEHPCVDCGASDTHVLDFDHREGKVANVSTLVISGAPLDVLEAEIAKCAVRCANCHRRRTSLAVGSYRALALATREGIEPSALTFVV